jgi:GTP-binding protein YchF
VRIGIIGLKYTGKTTLYNAITGSRQPTAQGGVEPHRAMAKVPDPRLDRLTALFKPRRQVNASVEWVDVPGFAPGVGADGTRESTRFLEHGRKMDALAQVVRCFDGGYGPPDPRGELEMVALEMALADLQIVENRLERLQGDKQKKGKVDNPLEPDLLERFRRQLEADRPLREIELNTDEARIASGFNFLTRKPLMAILNLEEGAEAPTDLLAAVRKSGSQVIALCAKVEEELAELTPQEQSEFLADLGLAEPALHRMIRAAYSALDLQSFFTWGEDECRAWAVHKGALAPQAAGIIHSDMERGFIRAEVCAYDDLMAAGDMTAAKAAGKVRLEGKSYEVQDGDLLTIRFSV